MAQILSPLAQSFFVDGDKYPNGVFVKEIGLYFKAKDSNNMTISVQLRPMTNGFPDNSNSYAFGTSTRDANGIIVRPPDTVASMPTFAESYSETVFSFPAPVYLLPGEHCFVIQTYSKDYELYVARMGEKTLLNEQIRISSQPYTGVLFKSSNGFTYTPEQNEDLMFRLGVCNFTTNAHGICRMRMLASNEERIPHSDLFKYIPNHSILNSTNIDYYYAMPESNVWFTKFQTSTDITGSSSFSANNVSSASLLVEGAMITTDKYVSPVIDEMHTGTVLVKNEIGDGAIEDKNIVLISGGTNYGPTMTIGGVGSGATGWFEVRNGSIVAAYVNNPGSGYGANIDNIPVTINANGYGSGASMTAVSNATGNIIGFANTVGGTDYGPVITVSAADMMLGETCFLGCTIGGDTLAKAGIIQKINILESGFGYYKSPSITFNVGGGTGSGASAQINLEDRKSGGNCKARYITKQVQLNFDSSSLKVFMDINRPAETEIRIFAKFMNRDDPTNIRESLWKEMSIVDTISIPVAINHTSFAETAFQINNVDYNKTIDGVPNNFIGFNSFKVKICMYSKSTSIVPRIRSFRAVAVK